MTEPFDGDLLDDPARLVAADSGGLLRAAATAGAQVRSTAETAAEVGLGRFADQRPRALVLITRPGAPAAAAPLLAALLGPSCPVPVLTARSVPTWVGTLDVVLAHTSDPGDRELAAGLDRAGRQGAGILLSAPADGPVSAAAAGHAALLVPRVEVTPGLALPGAMAAGLVLLDTLGLLPADPEPLADALDLEAQRDHPEHESLVNPAKTWALRMADHTPLLWGTDAIATAVAGHAAATLAAHAGVIAHAADYLDAVVLPALRARAARSTSHQDVFHDPYLDGQDPSGRPRPFLLGVVNNEPAAAARAAAARLLPGVELIGADEDLMVPATDVPAAARVAAVLALRADHAALYLGLGHRVFVA